MSPAKKKTAAKTEQEIFVEEKIREGYSQKDAEALWAKKVEETWLKTLTPLERLFHSELAAIELVRTTRNTPEATTRTGEADRFGSTKLDAVLREGRPIGVMVSRTQRDGTPYPLKSFIPNHNIKAYQFGDIAVGVTTSDSPNAARPRPVAAPVNDEEVLGQSKHEPGKPTKPRPVRPPLNEEPEIDEGAVEELERFQAEIDQTQADHDAKQAIHHAVDEEVLDPDEA